MLPQRSDETLFSYRFGAVYKPTPHTSHLRRLRQCPHADLGDGAARLRHARRGDARPIPAPPRRKPRSITRSAPRRICSAAGCRSPRALFRNERSNFRVPSNDPINPTLQVVDGRSRVDGLALGASGNITPEWQIFANYTYLDSKVLQSVSDFCLANPSVACLNSNPANYPAGSAAGSIVIADPQAGDDLIQTPRHSGSLFTTYRLPFGLQVGYGLTYQGSFATHQRTLLQRTQYRADDFLIQRLFASYAFTNGLTASSTSRTCSTSDYFTNIRNNVGTALTGTANNGIVTGGWAAPGEGGRRC